MVKRGRLIMVVAVSLILLIIPLISAGFFDNIWGKITGKITDTTNLTITVSGVNPVRIIVWNATMVGTLVDPTPSGNTTIAFYVNVSDVDGSADVNTSSVNATFSFYDAGLGEPVRTNGSYGCASKGAVDPISINFSCAIDMTYYDAPGYWVITVYARDGGNQTNIISNVANGSTSNNFNYDVSQGVTFQPTVLAWDSVSPGDTNKTSTNDPTLINNTGNFNWTVISINSTDLPGVDNATEFIPAANFSIGNSTGGGGDPVTDECGGGLNDTDLIAQVYKIMDKGVLSRGDYFFINDNVTGQEQIFWCAQEIPTTRISSQTYTTAALNEWTIQLV